MTDSTKADWVRAASVANVVADRPTALAARGLELVAVRTPGGLKVYEGRCPHQGALLGEGDVEDGHLVCRNHRWRFDIATGRRDKGSECLRACPAEERDGAVYVDLAPLRQTGPAAAKRTLDDLPGPASLPLVGNALELNGERLHLVLEDWAQKFGPIYRFKVGTRSYLGVSDPELIEVVLRSRPETYRRDDRVEPVFAELGVAGVFSAEGTAWRQQRRLAMEALSQKNLRGFFPTLVQVAERLRTKWERSAASGQTINVVDDLIRFTVDVTTTLTFGRDLDTIGGGEDVIQKDLALVFPTFARRLNALFPYWRYVRLRADRDVDRAIASLRVWLSELVTDARARLAAEPERAARPSNFLEAMLSARDDEGRPFSEETLFGNCMTMLLAGEDTTAQSAAWAIHLLCERPDEVEAMRRELDAVLGDAAVPPDLERTNRLDYATAVTNEAMRLKPVAPLNFSSANHDTVLGDVAVPRGTGVVALLRRPAMDARWFAAPEAFRPRRWIDGGADGSAHDPSALLPFGSGPRICPGRSLALVEMRILLATLYKNFDVERVGQASDVAEKFAFTVMPTDFRVRIRARAKAAVAATAS